MLELYLPQQTNGTETLASAWPTLFEFFRVEIKILYFRVILKLGGLTHPIPYTIALSGVAYM